MYETNNGASNTESKTESNAESNTERNGGSKGGSNGASNGARELANTLGFSISHIKKKILPRMIADGLLEPYDKQSPKSPEQK